MHSESESECAYTVECVPLQQATVLLGKPATKKYQPYPFGMDKVEWKAERDKSTFEIESILGKLIMNPKD